MAMHADELDLSHEVAERLLVALLPGVTPSDVHRVESTATTSHIFRIGSDLTARFPIVRTDPHDARTAIEVEHRAMAELAAASPLPAPKPVAIGEPDPEYPMPWSVQTWVPGDVADADSVASSDAAAGDMHERKLRIAELGDAFVALPGGAGTLEELFEVWTWQQLGIHAKPVALYDVAGYWQPLLTALDEMTAAGFLSERQRASLVVASEPEQLINELSSWVAPAAKWERPAPESR